jgi:hypothetical protein
VIKELSRSVFAQPGLLEEPAWLDVTPCAAIRGRIDVPDATSTANQQIIPQLTNEPSSLHGSEFCRTDALPGSPEKLDVLAKRLERGEPLWHPEDRILFLEPGGSIGPPAGSVGKMELE